MVPNVTHGGRTRGLLRYLTSPKEQAAEQQLVGLEPRELHTNPHVVAGYEGVAEEWGGYDLSPRYNPSAADELAAWLDEPRVRSGARVTRRRRDREGNVLVDERGNPRRTDAHVWHCSLSLDPHDPELSDEQWRGIAEQFIDAMGFAEHRWLAMRHGRSPGSEKYPDGQDHIHLVVQLVGENGTAANIHNDFNRAQEQCRTLERAYGLRVLEGRNAKRGARATNYRQRYRAEREHRDRVIDSPEPDRELLERAVRRLAAASASEGEFVRRLRSESVIVRPRFDAGRDDRVIGYSVGLTPPDGKPLVRHAGGKLAKDLTLPRLRGAHGWTAEDPEAIDEWRRAFDGQDPGVGAESNPWLAAPSWDQALEQLRQLRDSARHLPTDDRGAWAQTAAQSAAVLYGWAELAGEHAPALRETARELALSAQIRAADARPEQPLPRPRSVALLCAAVMRPSNQTLFWLALGQELQALATAIGDMHQAAGEAQRAAQLADTIRDQLTPVTAHLDDEHAAADPDYGEARQAIRLARVGQPPVSDITRQPARPPAPSPPRAPRPAPQRKPGRGT